MFLSRSSDKKFKSLTQTDRA